MTPELKTEIDHYKKRYDNTDIESYYDRVIKITNDPYTYYKQQEQLALMRLYLTGSEAYIEEFKTWSALIFQHKVKAALVMRKVSDLGSNTIENEPPNKWDKIRKAIGVKYNIGFKSSSS